MAAQKKTTKKNVQQEDDNTLKWIAIGGLSAIFIVGPIVGLAAAYLNSSPQQAQTAEVRQNKKNDKKNSAESKKDDKQKVADAKKDDKAKPLTEEQKKENDAKFEELMNKADDAANKSMQATSNDKRETYLAAEKNYYEAALNYARTDEQKCRANYGISVCYQTKTLHGGNISESDAAKWLSCAQHAVNTATTELQKGQAYTALSQAQEYNGLYREAISNMLTSSEHYLNEEITSNEDRAIGVPLVCFAGLNTLKYLHDTDAAKQIFQKALTLATEENAGNQNKAMALAGLTLAALMEGNKQEADRNFQSAVQYDKGTAYTYVGNWSKPLGIELSPQTNSSQAYANSSNMLNENPEVDPRQWAKNREREIIQQKRREIYEQTGVDYAKYVPTMR